MINIYYADNHNIAREGLRSLISSVPDMQMVGDAPHGNTTVANLKAHQPDVFLMDLTVTGYASLQLIEYVERKFPKIQILVLSMHQEEHYATRTIRAGAKGFIAKTRPLSELLDALREVSRGKLYVSEELARRLAQKTLTKNPGNHLDIRLTNREYEVYLSLAEGMRVSEIATMLHLSSKTVSTHKARMMKKLGVSSISALVHYSMSPGLV